MLRQDYPASFAAMAPTITCFALAIAINYTLEQCFSVPSVASSRRKKTFSAQHVKLLLVQQLDPAKRSNLRVVSTPSPVTSVVWMTTDESTKVNLVPPKIPGIDNTQRRSQHRFQGSETIFPSVLLLQCMCSQIVFFSLYFPPLIELFYILQTVSYILFCRIVWFLGLCIRFTF